MIRTVTLVLGLMLSAPVAAAPVRLTDAQMDLVTAGLAVQVDAFAAATGQMARTDTDAAVRIIDRGVFSIGIGRATAAAAACCGEQAQVEATTAAQGEGDVVHVFGRSFEGATPRGRFAFSSILIVVVEFDRAVVGQRFAQRMQAARWRGWRPARHGW